MTTLFGMGNSSMDLSLDNLLSLGLIPPIENFLLIIGYLFFWWKIDLQNATCWTNGNAFAAQTAFCGIYISQIIGKSYGFKGTSLHA
jgi:hypothetical protein